MNTHGVATIEVMCSHMGQLPLGCATYLEQHVCTQFDTV